VRACPVAVGGHLAVLVDRHVSYLPYASFEASFVSVSVTRLDHRSAAPVGRGRFRVESQPKKRLTGVLSGGPPRESSGAAHCIGSNKGVIRICALFGW
jgi:hypothetical protein